MKHILIFLTVFLLSLQCNAQTLHISWRGESHDVYLGCLNCSRYDSNSIWNSYGNYGSKYDSKSIWNKYGDYGGSYSTYSPFYNYANYPPAIVDKDGNFYGYFTISSTKSKRANFDLVNIIYKHYEEIREDVSEWYDKIFN
jgi:hypothetical protein